MPRRASTRTETVVIDKQPEVSFPRLKFNEPLSWRAGKAINVAELLKRLTALSKELREMDQEEIDRDSLTKVSKELAGHHLLAHKDKGVRAWTACCLVDILRLCAPDAPFTAAQLKDIFTLFITTILPALSDPSNAYNTQHILVLQSLAQVKSIILLTDIPSSEALILHLFRSFFDISSGSSKSATGEQIAKNVEFNMSTILVTLVDEAPNLPAEVVDIIVAQFFRVDPGALNAAGSKDGKSKKNGITPATDDKQSTLRLKELPPAYNMAKTICNSCPEKMARYIGQYFNDVILDASSSTIEKSHHHHRRASNEREDSDDGEGPSGPTEEDLKELRKAHKLLRELWRACPAVLQNAIPQLEAELPAENVQLRLLATETLGDMVSGIGAAGPPPPPAMDPSAYPPTELSSYSDAVPSYGVLSIPSSPQSFPQTHPAVYASFLSRQNDKSALIRSAWTTSIGRILVTSAGGVGLSQSDEQTLVKGLAVKLLDSDERVRISAVRVVSGFGFRDIVFGLGSNGGVTEPGSILANLVDRVRDRKHGVRVEAMKAVGRIWGVAAGEIAAGNETVISLLGAIPTRIFDTVYINDLELNVLIEHVLFESLLPLGYPSLKSKGSKVLPGESQGKGKGKEPAGDKEKENADADKIRTERLLLLIKDLDTKAKKAFFSLSGRQAACSHVTESFLKKCEEFNGGVMDENEAAIKKQLHNLIDWFAKQLPDSARATADLLKFAKMNDRRNHQLIRFCMAPESDYRTVHKAIKELTKRIEAAPGSPAGMLETITPFLYRVSLLIYNKSHVPAIVEYSRRSDNPLESTAHEVLKEISTIKPQIFRAHVKELCGLLEEQAPTATKANDPGTVDTLKACAGFAAKFPRDMPTERKFLQALVNFALYGSPPEAAKHAVTILVAAAERKEMYVTDLLKKCITDFKFGANHFLARLATLSQLMFLTPKEADEENDPIIDIATKEILLKVRTTKTASQKQWLDDDEIDDECKAKLWALKILVNRLRSSQDVKESRELAEPVIKLLNTLVTKEGELSKKLDTPPAHKSRLRLIAAQLLLKLCKTKVYDELLAPDAFNRLACVAQDSIYQVRLNFVSKLKKYLGQTQLPVRFYTIVFLMAYEPQEEFRDETITWIKARAKLFAQQKGTVMESVFSRLLSLLAHHPDFSPNEDDLADFSKYILFYLRPVATEENLSLIFYVAQRVKQARDAISSDKSDNLYCLSDLAQAIIQRYEDINGWSMQAWPGKLKLPVQLFAPLASHAIAQEIANKSYLPKELEERLDGLVKARPKTKKRKSDSHPETPAPPRKKAKSSASAKPKSLPVRKASTAKTPKKPKRSDIVVPSSERRRSGRSTIGKVKTYAELDDEDDIDMWDEDGDEEENDTPTEEEEAEEEVDKPEEDDDGEAGDETAANVGPAKEKGGGGGREQTNGDSIGGSMGDDDDDDDISDPPDSD
ncbi:MAG: hypothetical protein M1839_006726 [Geoglossum umbratile]|nr:MAG: hypothetical protein M1839_006726 [Geoglossum umbratile]